MAAALTPGFNAYNSHYLTEELARIFGIKFKEVRDLIYDEAMNGLNAERVKTAYLKRLQNLRSKTTM